MSRDTRTAPILGQGVAEEHFRLLVASVRDYAIFHLDPTGHVASWNLGAERAKGYRADEIIGRHFSTFYTEEDRASGKCEMELEVAAREGRFEDEGLRQRKDGSLFWANVVITALRAEDGTLVGFAKVTRDLTERKLAEEERIRHESERKAREAADAANRAKDEFLAHVSHELRTPLNAILGWARLLSSGLDDARQPRAIATIERNAEAMVRLIEDLLDVSRIVSGKMRLEASSVDMALVIERAVDAVRLSAEAKNVRLQTTIAGRTPILGDASRLQQVVWNLLSNAVKFTPKEGRVEIALRRDGAIVEIGVHDTGVGLRPADLSNVFAPFWQAAPSHSSSSRGLGLGLAIVRSIVELHGGTVEARSEGPGRGATFLVRLPVATDRGDDGPPTPPLAPEPGNRLRGLCVLVVEDDDDARELLRTLLERFGVVVRTAATAEEGFASFTAAPPDLLVSDVGLPGESGYDLVRRVRLLPREAGGRVPAVALTAYARAEDRTSALLAGFQMHVPKPVEATELVTVLGSLVESFAVAPAR